MRNILYLILIIVTVAVAVSYSVNFYNGKGITELPVQISETPKPEKPAYQMPGSDVSLLPEEPDMANTDVYSRVNEFEKSINTKLSIIARSSNNKEVIARIDQLSKQLETDVTLVLAAVNKKEQWYRNEFQQVLAGLLDVLDEAGLGLVAQNVQGHGLVHQPFLEDAPHVLADVVPGADGVQPLRGRVDLQDAPGPVADPDSVGHEIGRAHV